MWPICPRAPRSTFRTARPACYAEGEELTNLITEIWFLIEVEDASGETIQGWAAESRVRIREEESLPPAPVVVPTPAAWLVGPNAGCPDPVQMAQLEKKIEALEHAEGESQPESSATPANGFDPAQLRREHQRYIRERERLEFQLSLVLNQRKHAQDGALTHDYLYRPDPVGAELGLALNRLRIKRRIYDYVVAALPE